MPLFGRLGIHLSFRKQKKVHSILEQSCLICEIRARAVAAANVGRTAHLGICDGKSFLPSTTYSS